MTYRPTTRRRSAGAAPPSRLARRGPAEQGSLPTGQRGRGRTIRQCRSHRVVAATCKAETDPPLRRVLRSVLLARHAIGPVAPIGQATHTGSATGDSSVEACRCCRIALATGVWSHFAVLLDVTVGAIRLESDGALTVSRLHAGTSWLRGEKRQKGFAIEDHLNAQLGSHLPAFSRTGSIVMPGPWWACWATSATVRPPPLRCPREVAHRGDPRHRLGRRTRVYDPWQGPPPALAGPLTERCTPSRSRFGRAGAERRCPPSSARAA